MGDKSDRCGKHILLYLAAGCLIAAVNISACAPVQKKIAEIRAEQRLEQYRADLAAGRFDTVIRESNRIIEHNDSEPPADIALYSLGEVYAHQDFKDRNYDRSRAYFETLIKNFPQSPLTAEAKTYISLFDTLAARDKALTEQKSAPPPKVIKPAKEKSAQAVPPPRLVIENQNFDEAIQKNLNILDKVGKKKPADQALYNLGLIYAHADNPGKDYKKAQLYFHVLVKQFPDSEYAEEAKIWLGLFATIEKMQQIDIEIERQKKQLIR